jgi:hypothetical protein
VAVKIGKTKADLCFAVAFFGGGAEVLPFGKGSVNEIVIFSVGFRSAVSILGEENFILAKNPPLDGTKLGSSLLSLEGLSGRSPAGAAFWPS